MFNPFIGLAINWFRASRNSSTRTPLSINYANVTSN